MLRQSGEALTVGIQMALTLLIFTLGGRYLDGKFGGRGIGVAVGAGIGFICCGYEVWKWIRRVSRDAGSAGNPPPKP